MGTYKKSNCSIKSSYSDDKVKTHKKYWNKQLLKSLFGLVLGIILIIIGCIVITRNRNNEAEKQTYEFTNQDIDEENVSNILEKYREWNTKEINID